jgi:hypothetical protein
MDLRVGLFGAERNYVKISPVTGRVYLKKTDFSLRYANSPSLDVYYICKTIKQNGLVNRHKSDGTVKSSRCKARESLGMRRTYQYAAVTKGEAQRRPSALLRAVSPSTLLRTVSLSNGLSNGRWTF